MRQSIMTQYAIKWEDDYLNTLILYQEIIINILRKQFLFIIYFLRRKGQLWTNNQRFFSSDILEDTTM